MDQILFGRGVKSLRLRKRWRQDDLAAAAQVSRGVVARIERGHADRVTVATLDKVAAALGGRVACRLTWNGEGLDRLLDAQHAAFVETVVRTLRSLDWLVATEVSFNNFGEGGSIDILAFSPPSGVVLVIEVKSVVPDVQAMLVALDRKERLARQIAHERGWDASSVARLLVLVRTGLRADGSRRTRRRSATCFRIAPARFGAGWPSRVRGTCCEGSGSCQAILRRSLSRASGSSAGQLSVAQARIPDNRSPGGGLSTRPCLAPG
jgi:transcriptional regulator with XRE-family HTH domain